MASLVPVLVFTGVSAQLAAQRVNAFRLADPSTHWLPWLRYLSSTLLGFALDRRRPKGSAPVSRRVRLYLVSLGLTETIAYVTYSVGAISLGSSASSVILAGASQILTAVMGWALLGRRLTAPQMGALAVIVAGVSARGRAAIDTLRGSAGGAAAGLDPRWGAAFIAVSALAYAALGIIFDALMRGPESRDVPFAAIAVHMSVVGLLATSVAQATNTLPRWSQVVHIPSDPSRRAAAAAATLVFLVTINAHVAVHSRVQRAIGALGVKVVTAVAGATLTLASHAAFCSPEDPTACASSDAVISAGITLLGGVLWAVATHAAQRAAMSVEPVEDEDEEQEETGERGEEEKEEAGEGGEGEKEEAGEGGEGEKEEAGEGGEDEGGRETAGGGEDSSGERRGRQEDEPEGEDSVSIQATTRKAGLRRRAARA